MPAAMAVEDFFTGERDLHRSPGFHRELGDDHLVVEWIALATEAATVGAGNDAHLRRRHLEHFCHRTVDVVRCLRRRPQRHLAVGPVGSKRRVLFHGKVRVALKEERVLAHDVSFGEPFLEIAELERDRLVDVALHALVELARMDRLRVFSERVFDAHDRL